MYGRNKPGTNDEHHQKTRLNFFFYTLRHQITEDFQKVLGTQTENDLVGHRLESQAAFTRGPQPGRRRDLIAACGRRLFFRFDFDRVRGVPPRRNVASAERFLADRRTMDRTLRGGV